MEIITRLQALALGLDRYFTGKPCKNGHTCERSTRWRQCFDCLKETEARYRSAHPGRSAKGRHDIPSPRADEMRRQREEFRDAEQERASKKLLDQEELRHNSPIPIVTREEARKSGLPRYYTGVACVNGHLCERMTKGKQCLECHRNRRTEKRKSDPDLIKSQKAASYAKHRDETNQRRKDYLAENREEVAKKRKVYRGNNRDRINARMSAYAKANRPKMRVGERLRRDRERGATGKHTYADIKALEVSQAMICANEFCRVDITAGYHIDHVMPIALGGTNDAANLQLLCGPCNLSKGDLHPDEWQKRNEATHQSVT